MYIMYTEYMKARPATFRPREHLVFDPVEEAAFPRTSLPQQDHS